jgi:hypothetical protein
MDPIGKTPREYWTDVRAIERFSIHMLDKMRKNAQTIVKEAADVANFAMMIADNAKEETP